MAGGSNAKAFRPYLKLFPRIAANLPPPPKKKVASSPFRLGSQKRMALFEGFAHLAWVEICFFVEQEQTLFKDLRL